MDMMEIVYDSLRYPFSDWKKFLILGFIIWISSIPCIAISLGQYKSEIFVPLSIIGIIIIFFTSGYDLRIISSSLSGANELPEFNAWIKMFTDGIKLLIVIIIYLIPVISIILSLLYSRIDLDTFITVLSLLNSDLIFYSGFYLFIAFLYLIMIIPLILMSIANMAYNNSKLSAAFKFKEIFINISKLSWDKFTWDKFTGVNSLIPIVIGFFILDYITERIYNIGWKKLIIWYIATGIISLTLILIGYFITNIISILILYGLDLYSLSNYNILRILIISLFLLPYLSIFISRSTALIYNSAIKTYLINESSTRNYQLSQE